MPPPRNILQSLRRMCEGTRIRRSVSKARLLEQSDQRSRHAPPKEAAFLIRILVLMLLRLLWHSGKKTRCNGHVVPNRQSVAQGDFGPRDASLLMCGCCSCHDVSLSFQCSVISALPIDASNCSMFSSLKLLLSGLLCCLTREMNMGSSSLAGLAAILSAQACLSTSDLSPTRHPSAPSGLALRPTRNLLRVGRPTK